jgi:PQ loop repeat.
MHIENLKVFIEIGFSIALFVNAVLFVPQIIKLWRTKEAKGLSLLTFAGFNLIQILAVLHGYLKQDYVLMVSFLLSLITCGVITIQIIIYKKVKKICMNK